MSTIASPFAAHALATAPASNAASTVPPDPTDPLASESTFLTLLVSQLQNQDPLSPVDSTSFISQLTSYSQLEQLIGIHSNTTSLAGAIPAAGTDTTPATTTSGS